MGETISARDIGGVISEIEREFPGVRVTSADRTAQQNAAVGGAQDSQHLHGRARDLDISAIPENRRGALVERLKSLGVTGMGMYGPTGTSLHVDMREGPFRAWGPDRTRNTISQTPSYFQQVANTTNPQGPRATPPPASNTPNIDMTGLSPGMSRVLGMQMTNANNQARTATDIARITQNQQEQLARGERDASKAYAGQQRRLTQELERRQQPIPEFVATRETARDIGSLASLLMVAGSMLGGKGKQGALMAVQAMTGMMAGYRQGRQDLYQRERQNYETGLRQVQAQNQQLQQAFERSMRTAQTDLEAARAEFRVAATELGANLPVLMGQQVGQQGTAQIMNHMTTVVGQVEQADRTARAAAETRRQANVDAIERQKNERDRANIESFGPRSLETRNLQTPEQRARTDRFLSQSHAGEAQARAYSNAQTTLETSERTARAVSENRDVIGVVGSALNRLRGDQASSVGNILQNFFSGGAPAGEARFNQDIDRAVQEGYLSQDQASRAKIISKELFSLALADAQGTGRATVWLERALQDFYSQSLRPETLLTIIHERAQSAASNLPEVLRPNTRTDYNDNFSILSTLQNNRFDPAAFQRRYPAPERTNTTTTSPGSTVTPGAARAPGAPTQRWVPGRGLVPIE
jgi:hypothetical protein